MKRLVVFWLLLFMQCRSHASLSPIHPGDLTFYENFNNQVNTTQKNNLVITKAEISGIDTDKYLVVDQHSKVTLKPAFPVNLSQGSVSVWVKPMQEKTPQTSATILSFRWKGRDNGYFALSQGWWEPSGANRIYFILDNQDSIHCSLPYKLTPDFWTHIAVTWSNGEKGFCRLYIDGIMAAEHKKPFYYDDSPEGILYIGSDLGTGVEAKGRFFNGCIDEIAFSSKCLSSNEISDLFKSKIKNKDLQKVKQYGWLADYTKLPLKIKKGTDGKYLESRVIFDEDISWALSREKTDEILKKITYAGFNVYIPCVWYGGGTYYDSPVADCDTRLKNRIASGDDPLAYLISQARQLGIEIHPWFTVVKREGDRYPEFFDNGTPKDAYDVHNPEFRKFIVRLMADVVARYDIGGVNLDYIRSMGICTSDACRNDYEQRFNHHFWLDYSQRYIKGNAFDRIQKWQDDAVGDIVRQISIEAKKMKPGIMISVDAHLLNKEEKRPLEGRDPVRWMNEGWIDVLFAMDYRERIDFKLIDSVKSELANPCKLIVLFGNYDRIEGKVFPRSGKLISDYVEYSRRKWPHSGMAFYIYGQLNDDQVNSLHQFAFKENARPHWN